MNAFAFIADDALRLLGDHLWQSTACVGAVAILCWALRRHEARVHVWLWLGVSLKFFVPAIVLMMLGASLVPRFPVRALTGPDRAPYVASLVSEPFSTISMSSAGAASDENQLKRSTVTGTATPWVPGMTGILLTAWVVGAGVVAVHWARRWRLVASMTRDAVEARDGREIEALARVRHATGIATPIRLQLTTTTMEPGVFGLFQATLLWPRQLTERLTDAQIDSLMLHELSHARRRDNLISACHMLTEVVFWFHPLVWWVGARLLDARERACDEEVVRRGAIRTTTYASAIVSTCQFCMESPLTCASGITGSDLKRRVEAIMRNRSSVHLTRGKKLALVCLLVLGVGAPIALGAASPHAMDLERAWPLGVLARTLLSDGTAECAQPLKDPDIFIPTPRRPAFVALTSDGCTVFVRTDIGVSTFRRRKGQIEPVGKPVTLPGVSGMDLVLTHDERMLVVRTFGRLVFYDVAKLTEGDDDPLIGSIASEQFPTVSTPGTSMAVTPDDRRLIVANHPTYSITVVDLDRVRASGPSSDAVILQMPTATWPSKPVVSRDGERLYLALGLGPPHRLGEPDRPGHQVYPGIPDAADICRHSRPEDGNGQFRPGVVQVFNLARLLTSSQTSASSTFIAGCEPTNFAFSPDEGTIYVAPRADDDVLTFDMASAAEQRMPSPIGVVPVLATGPTGIAVAQNGRTLVVSNSHDRDMSGPTFLTVIDAARVAEGRAAIRGTIPTRSIKIQSVVVANDGHTVFIPNREANLLQVVDLERVALSPLPAAAER